MENKYVYVLSYEGKSLMPTRQFGKVRMLLKTGKAKVVKRTPFTIQLLYKTTEYTQPITLGVDTGSKTIGLSATTKDKELYASNVELRNDITRLLADRAMLRRSRRRQKTRYRKPRFMNRTKSKKASWIAPSIRQKIQTHETVIANVHKLLPISKIIVELASFDIQKIQNPDISGKEYQEGKQLDFWNVREYVLFRDGHICQACKGKSKDKILNVHHIESRKTGGNSPSNLITLCETCHKAYHAGTLKLKLKRGQNFKDAAFMGIMRWRLYDKLKATYPDVSMTYGYITKNTRILNNLPKDHYIDARCISGNPTVKPLGYYYYQRKYRCHNRKIHKSTYMSGSKRIRAQAPYIVKGFRLHDKVKFKGKEWFVMNRYSSCGCMTLNSLNGDEPKPHSPVYKKIKLLEKAKTYINEIRKASYIIGSGKSK